ncbi:major facilitator superfamily domain-containing protein [Phthorimaea operculella]|nr:major facilitator superfamily domain-containing protein [Phthorimaea operculella]
MESNSDKKEPMENFTEGTGLSGYLIKNFGYYAGFSVSLCFHIINFTYIACFLKDPPRSIEQKKHDHKGFFYKIGMFVSLSNIKESFRVLVRSGPNHRRARVLVSLATICSLFGPLYGEAMVMYLVTRYRFNWDEVTFSIFQSYNFVTHTLGTLFSLTVFSKYLGWHDSLLGIISIVSKIASSFVYCFAPNGRIFFIAPMVEILNGTSMLAMRSFLSKLVAPNELGKISSLISLMENFTPIIYIPLYTNVYRATMDVLPGAIFLMGSALVFPALIVFIYLFYEQRKNLRKEKRDDLLDEVQSR